jgi:DNA-binding winged helix-turn-helix (wHTH) protein
MSTERYLIGKSTLDVSLGCLRRNGADVSLRPKSFALLHYLVTHAGRLVTKDELLSKIWPDVIVTEDSLTRCISEVRAALEDSGQTIIKTVSKRGYVFAGPVTLLDEQAVPLPPADGVPEHNDERAGCRYGPISSMCVVPNSYRRRTTLSRVSRARFTSNSFRQRPGAR